MILGLGQFGSKVLVIVMMGFYQAALGKEGYAFDKSALKPMTAVRAKNLPVVTMKDLGA